MCTLTLFPLGEGRYRLAFNRDESSSRAPAEPPRRHWFGNRAALLPTDPVGRGTWIAVNDAGLALALLNVNPPEKAASWSVPGSSRSRGTIIPALLDSGSLDEALRRAVGLPFREYAPFRLVLFARGRRAELCWDGERIRRECPATLAGPLMCTSSGLGDHLAESPRRQLFEATLRQAGNVVARQDAFHRHAWHDSPHLSVCMSRADARTVSHTVIGLGRSDAVLTYYASAPDRPAPAVTACLRFAHGGMS